MKRWINILKAIKTDNSLGLKLLFVLTCVYCLSTALYFPYLKIVFIGIGLYYMVISKNPIKDTNIWSLFFIIFAIDLTQNFYDEANHHFLLTYTTLVVLLHLKGFFSYTTFVKNIKYLIIIVLAFATLQKLFSKPFINGEFYYYMFSSGKFFKQFVTSNIEQLKIIRHNDNAIHNLTLINPNISNTPAYLKAIFPKLNRICIIFAWVTIAIEFIATLLVILKPKQKITHIIMLILITGIFATRLETGFLSILCVAGFLITPNRTIKLIYIALLLVFLSMIITQIGFY